MNWKKLKDFCNGLTEEQLKEKVIMWREDECVSRIEAMTLSEDHYINKENNEYGCFEESEMNSQINQNQELSREDFKKVYDKGFPVLWEDFF